MNLPASHEAENFLSSLVTISIPIRISCVKYKVLLARTWCYVVWSTFPTFRRRHLRPHPEGLRTSFISRPCTLFFCGGALPFYPEDKDSTFHRNVGKHLPDFMMSRYIISCTLTFYCVLIHCYTGFWYTETRRTRGDPPVLRTLDCNRRIWLNDKT